MFQVKTVEGQMVHLADEEVKRISTLYWERSGKKSMKDFFTHYQHKASENIRKALGRMAGPHSEEEVKGAIAMALMHGDCELAGDVLFESMEWQMAYATLKSIEDGDND
jgi:NhaP-type Na+/H+ and K+/H+ antiporter